MTFADEASLNKAVQLNGKELDGRTLRINKSSEKPAGGNDRNSFGGAAGGRPSFGGASAGPGAPTKTLMVRGLSYQADGSALESTFAEAEGFSGARVATDRETGQSRGFGFVEFENVDAAQKALNEYNGTDIAGRNINLSFAEERYGNKARRGSLGDWAGRGKGVEWAG